MPRDQPTRIPILVGVALEMAVVACALGCGGVDTLEVSIPDASVDSGWPLGPNASAGCTFDCDASCPPGAPLDCYVNTHCPDGGVTSLSGTVYDPAGRNAVYEAVVFVPDRLESLPRIVPGTSSCSVCDTSIGDYVAAAFSDATGHFTLRGVPTGENVPLVVQIGKWRRIANVPKVADCVDTAVPPESSRLPRNRTEGDLPQMALLTGTCDNFACFLRSLGVDATEFSAPHAGGRVDVYQGLGAAGSAAPLSNATAGDCTTDACPLWSSRQSLEFYDTVFLGCECAENNQTKPPSSMLALHDWLGEGGWVFATHSQATWFRNGPADFQSVASWTDGPTSGATGPFAVNTTSPEGLELEAWLASVGATGPNGAAALDPADVSTSVTAVDPRTTAEWINDISTAVDAGGALSGSVKLFSFEAPIVPDAGKYCGKAYFTDIHAGGGQALEVPGAGGSGSLASVPDACDGGPMTAEEKALEFFVLNQTSCNSPRVTPPPPPPPPGDGG